MLAGRLNTGAAGPKEGYLFSGKALRDLVIPLIIEQTLAITVGMADSLMVSSAGEAAVSAVSLVDSVFILIINLFAALATGGAVICGQEIGRRHMEVSSKAASQLVLFTGVFSLVLMGLTYLCRPFILNTVFGKIEPDVMEGCRIYLNIVAASIPFIALYNAGAAVFRAMGNSRISMLMSLLMNAINLFGNAILIYGLEMGVAGAAIPTLASRIAGAVVIIHLLFNEKLPVHLSRPFSFRPDFQMLHRLLRIAVPNGMENSMFQLGKILVLSLAAGFGTASIAANAVSNTLSVFQNLPGLAMGFAVLTVVSQCVGADDFDQARYYVKRLMILVHASCFVMSILVILALPWLVQLYHLSPEASGYVQKIITYHGICVFLIWPISFTLPNALRAAGDVTFPMVISIVSMWVFRIGFSYILGLGLHMGIFGIWVAMTIDWLFRAICFMVRYLGGKWTK